MAAEARSSGGCGPKDVECPSKSGATELNKFSLMARLLPYNGIVQSLGCQLLRWLKKLPNALLSLGSNIGIPWGDGGR